MLVDLRIRPVEAGTDSREQSASVAQVLGQARLSYRAHATGSTLEGDVDAILNAVRRCHKELRKDSSTTLIGISVDDGQAATEELVPSLQRLHEATERTPLARASQPTQEGREAQQDVRRIFRGTANGTRRS